jgi:hypothetical protein
MQGSASRALIAILVCAAVFALVLHNRGASAGADTGEITPEIRAATLNLDSVAPQDRLWIQNAIATARPEAQRLIAEVDGLVTVRTDLRSVGVPEDAIGLTISNGSGVDVVLGVDRLNSDRAIDRNMVVLHELGHVIDFLLVDDELVQRLDAGIPASRECGDALDGAGGCDAIPERFADTFAKWALRGAVSVAGAGYAVATPASLEDWGAPLAALAIDVEVASR